MTKYGRYSGDGEHFIGIPARTLDADEWSALGAAQRKRLTDSGLYTEVEVKAHKPKADAPPDPGHPKPLPPGPVEPEPNAPPDSGSPPPLPPGPIGQPLSDEPPARPDEGG